MLDLIFSRKPRYTEQERSILADTALVLDRMSDHHVFVDVRIPGVEETFRSMILDVDAEQGTFRIDELFPVNASPALPAGARLQVACRNRDESLRFETRVAGIDRSEDTPAYVLDIPLDADRNQRRDAYRLPVEGSGEVHAVLDGVNGHPLHANVLDLSSDGIRVLVDHDLGDLEAGRSVIPDCHLHLGGVGDIHCKLVVRNLEQASAGHETGTVVGGSFVSLNGFEKRQIAGYIASRQRRILRMSAA